MARIIGLSCVLSLLVSAAPVIAQVPGKETGLRVGAYFTYDAQIMSASDSFDAVLGSSTIPFVGVGADVMNVWNRVFARVHVSHASREGERVFVHNGEVMPLGVPVTVSMTPITVGGGWRFAPVGRARAITPYAGAGALIMRYNEESPFSGRGDGVDEPRTGYAVFGGVDVRFGRRLFVGGEVQYGSVPDALGDGGVSQDFDEDNLGGVAMRGRIGVRF